MTHSHSPLTGILAEHRRMLGVIDGIIAELKRTKGLCSIEYASMSQPLPIRCSFPANHRSDQHAGFDERGKVFLFPVLPDETTMKEGEL